MKGKFDWKLTAFSIIALVFVSLTFLISPYFIIGAVVFMLIGQWQLMKKVRKRE